MNINDHNWRVLVQALQSDDITPLGVTCVLADFADTPMVVPEKPCEAYRYAEKQLETKSESMK